MQKLKLSFREEVFNIHVSEKRYTIIAGESGRGKSYLHHVVEVLSNVNPNMRVGGYLIRAADGASRARDYIENMVDTIIFLDEEDAEDFAYNFSKTVAWGRNNHLVIFSREDFNILPYGAYDSFYMVRSGNTHSTIAAFEL